MTLEQEDHLERGGATYNSTGQLLPMAAAIGGRMKKLFCILAFLMTTSAWAQNPSTPVTGQITAATTNATCAGGVQNGGAVDQAINSVTGAVGISVTGTWSATLNIQFSVDHGKTWTASGGTFTTNQQSIISTTGASDVCVFASAYTSGTAIVTFATGNGVPGSGSGSTTVVQPTASQLNATVACTTGAAACQVQGAAASGSAATGNPVLIGGRRYDSNVQSLVIDNNGVLSAEQGTGSDAVTNGNLAFFPNQTGSSNPLFMVSGWLFNGSSWDRQVKCPTVVPITLGAAGTLQIVVPVAGQKVRVCALVLTESVAGTVQLTEGTGATCGTGTTNVTGAMTGALGQTLSLVMGPTSVLQTNVSGDGLCLVNGAATVSAGYAQIEQH